MLIKKLLNSKFKKDLFFSYITHAITISFGFLQLFLINKYYGVATYGQLGIIISTAGIFSSLLTARSSEAVTRFFKREELNKNYENAKLVLFIGFSIDFITAILLVVLLYVASTFIATTFLKDIDLRDEIIVYSFISFVSFLRGSMIGYLQSKEMFVKINSITIIESMIKIIILIVFIFLLNKIFLIDIIYAFLYATIISFLYTIYIFMSLYLKEYKNIPLVFNKNLLNEYWSFNIKTFISTSLKIGATNIDNLILGYYSTAETVGIYQTIKKLLSPISFLMTPLSTLTLPKIVKYYENKEFALMHIIIKKVTFRLIALSLLLLLLLISILKYYLTIQNITYTSDILLSFLLLSIIYLLSISAWWGRNFIIMYNPSIPIYSNILLSINSTWIPIALYQLNYFSGLVTISLGLVLAFVPNWLFAPIIYIKFMKKEKVI